MNFII